MTDRLRRAIRRPRRRTIRVPLGLLGLAVLLVACSGGAVASPGATSPGPTTPSVSTPAASAPAASPSSGGAVSGPEDAVARVVAHEPRLAGITALDTNLIGQSSWYEVAPGSRAGEYLVSVRVGWGDCIAGCINKHDWQYAVSPDGTVTVQSETGDPVPAEVWPAASQPGGQTGLQLMATAGPVCPVETNPPDPSCAPRVVPGAQVVVQDASGTTVAEVTLDLGGLAFVPLPAGSYTVVAGPVDGLMGTPAPVGASVIEGAAAVVELNYDTGIR